MIDLHSHVLHAVDDGPEAIEGSVALARAAVAAGTTTLAATPHVSPRFPTEPETIAARVAELRDRLAEEEVELQIVAGAEVAISQVATIPAEELRRLCLGTGPWLLVEPPLGPRTPPLEETMAALADSGMRLLLAHPERCPAFQREPARLAALVTAGALTSVTAGSLVGRFGSRARELALRLAREELIHSVASDAHDRYQRPPGISSDLRQAGLGPLEEWLTDEVPAAILSGEEIPPHPRRPLAGPAAGGAFRRLRVRRRGRRSA